MSATSQDGPARKRRRKVLSCLDCRRRKLQCDRSMPACSRCTKAGKADSCLYIDDAQEEPQATRSKEQFLTDRKEGQSTLRSPSGPDLISKLELKDRRIRELEAALAQSGRSSVYREQRFPTTPESAIGHEDTTTTVIDRECMVLRGKSFKTKYFGSTHPGALISYIPELGGITKEAFEHFPALRQMRNDVHALKERGGEEDRTVSQVSDQDLRGLLLSKTETSELVHLYVDSFENIYHILHLPTFWQAYETMWQDVSTTAPHFVATVLLMMACVSCLSPQPIRYVAQSSIARNKSLEWIRYCEDWISRQSHKHVTAADFQIRCLLWLGRQTSARKIKRAWSDAGSVLRFCMSAGLHRNPDLLHKETSAVDKELRRRIWATVVDFELQASFDRGMVSAPWLLQSDCPGPSNLYDEDLSVDKPFTSRMLREFTPSSYLTLANESLMLRSTLNAVLNNVRQNLSFEEVKRYTEEIEIHIANIPAWSDRRSDVPKALLALRLQQYLMVLHDRQLRQASTAAERNFSKGILLETALQIVETHKSLVAKGNLALELYCLDPLRIAVSVAHLQSFIDPRKDLALSRSFELLTPQLMEDVLSLIQDKFYRFGREGRQLWITLTCDTVIRIRRQPDQRSAIIDQAVEKIVNPMYKLMACQELTPAAHSSEEASSNHVARLNNQSHAASVRELRPVSNGISSTLLDMDELDDWTFQDWFSTTDFQEIYQAPQELSFEPPR